MARARLVSGCPMSRQRLYLPIGPYLRMAEEPHSAKKAAAFLSYTVDKELDRQRAIRHYARMWSVSIGTAHGWMKDFDRLIEMADTPNIPS